MPDPQTPSEKKVDQLVLVVVPDEQAGELGKTLVAADFRFTVISASNGFLPAGYTCLMLGIDSGENERLLRLVEQVCKTRRRYIPAASHFSPGEGLPLTMIEAEVGSAHVYTLAIETYETF